MATEKQYLFYKLLFDEESAREKQLREHAKTYLSLSTLYSAFVIFVADKSLGQIASTIKYVSVSSILFMAIAFSSSLLVTQVAKYEAITDPSDVTEQFGDTQMDDGVFFDNRIAAFTVACERNANVNNKKVVLLQIAGYSLLVGIFLHAGFFVLRII